MLNFLPVGIFLILSTQACLCQIFRQSCSNYNVSVVKDFDIKKYSGKWYEYERYEAVFQLFTGCVTANYELTKNGKVSVTNKAKNLLFNRDVTITGEAYLANPNSTEAKLKVEFFPLMPAGDYWVIGTNYDEFSVVWACTYRLQFMWVLLRNLKITDEIKTAVNDIIDKAGLDKSKLKKTDNSLSSCGTF